jgi:hypothetical protein
MFLKLAFERVGEHEVVLEDLFGPLAIASSEGIHIQVIEG